ncbi:MAG: FAD-dependent oxidoreductase [Candidatus Sphingomonas phytovorans]|nr:FAD-dependent oxidoreductase [Sphingomonas sp.]WEJ99964.1 MAG: FAD-dependent oxidoreductase [Sphingomonas sp.]
MTTNAPRIVILGGGHAGANAVASLRQAGHDGEIVMISDESVLPYHRPPLSKAYLKGGSTLEALYLRPAKFYDTNNIEVLLDARATGIDTARKIVALADGREIAWELLILATGSVARRLDGPGADLDGVHVLRDVKDAEALHARIGAGSRLVIIGAGYIGLEVAASARDLGAEVTILEREPRILSRVACEELSGFFHRFHADRGVVFRTGVSVAALHGEKGEVCSVELSDGEVLPCDAVLVGIGGSPCDALAIGAGLQCDNGVIVDLAGRSSIPGIYAIGDMTRRPMPHYGDRMFRLESVPNAVDQARAVAADIMGKPLPAPDLPWFWSDQYELKLQIAGVPFDADRQIVRHTPDKANSFSIFHLSGDRVVAVEAVNAAGDFVAGKKLIMAAQPVDIARLSDPSIAAKTLLATSGD